MDRRPRPAPFSWILLLALLPLSRVWAAEPPPPPELQGLDAYIQKGMADWKVPGLAIAVVRDDRVVWARGFGLRTAGKTDPVDADTLFAIGSNTKAFTVAALGTLVGAGRLHWDDPVADELPGFQLFDPYASREATVRDLLSHRTGVCGEDGVWYATDFATREILARLRFQKPQYSFRSQFCYSNSLYMAAGEIIPALTGKTWSRYVYEQFLAPLHMNATVTSVTDLQDRDDVATPHAEIDNQVVPIEWDNINNIDPAGAIDSSVHDMSQWLKFLLADGKRDGRQLLSPAVIAEMETPQMLITDGDAEGRFIKSLNPESHFYAYGLGFFLQDYAGTKVVWHSGHIDGMSAGLALLPAEHVGVVVLSNMDQSWLPMAVVWRVLDAYTQQPPRDWSSDILTSIKSATEPGKETETKLLQAHEPGDAPLPLAAYTGDYENPLYGHISVALENGALVMHLSRRFVGDMHHWNHEMFQVAWRYRFLGKSYANFDLDGFGRPVSLRLTDMAAYTRVADKPAAPTP